MASEYYFISDLHVGGDGALDACEFEDELIAFLQHLEQNAEDAELILVGDTFGMWETTMAEGPDKLHAILGSHVDLFSQFKRAGEKVRITAIPGNHDHELACHPELVGVLSAYNIHLEPERHITREIGGRTIWIEHGNQYDDYNRFEAFGNALDRPIGYHVTRNIVSGASTRAHRARDQWLKYVESVYPTEYLPHWLFSNYFYREMSTVIRVLVLPFLLLLATSAFMCAGALLELAGAVRTGAFLSSFANSLGSPGYLLDAVFILNSALIVFIALFSIPYLFLRRDLRRVLSRYGIDLSDALRSEKESHYLEAAERLFTEHPEAALFVFGHTHMASVRRLDGRAIVNTGTWMQRLTCVTSHFYLLPAVYCPSYHLGYFRVHLEGREVLIDHHTIPKEAPQRLSLLQRLAIIGRARDDSPEIPRTTALPAATADAPEEGPAAEAPNTQP